MPPKGSSTQLPTTCRVCGSSFSVLPCYVRRGGGRYCSRTCYHRARERVVGTACDTCGVRFTVKPCDHKPRNYCSLACAHIGHRATSGEWVKPLSDAQRDGLKAGQSYFRGKTAKDDPVIARRIEAIAAKRRGKPNPKHGEALRRLYAQHPERHPNHLLAQKGHETGLERAMRLALTEAGLTFETQVRIGSYWVDFAIPTHRLAIEVDGAYWHNTERDAIRDGHIAAHGWTVVRFSEDRINADVGACAEEVRQRLE